MTISLKNLPFVVLSEPSVGIKTCLIESGLTLKPLNLSCLAACDKTIKTLLTTTVWLNLIVKSRTTLPHLDKGGRGWGEREQSVSTHIIVLWLLLSVKIYWDLTNVINQGN